MSLVSKLLGGERRKKKKKTKKMARRRNNIVMVKRDTPKRVTLPNGRTFLAKYKRVTRQYLPGGTTIARTYRGQPVQGRRPTGGRPPARATPAAAVTAPPAVRLPGVARAVARAGNRRVARGAAWRRGIRLRGRGLNDVAKSVANNPFAQDIGKKLIKKGINSIPYLYNRATKKIKNKNLKKNSRIRNSFRCIK